MEKMFMRVDEVMEALEVSESYAYKLIKRTGSWKRWDARPSPVELTASIFTSSSMEQNHMMGGAKNGSLQE